MSVLSSKERKNRKIPNPSGRSLAEGQTLAGLFVPHAGAIILAVVCLCVANLLGLSVPLALKLIIDDVLVKKQVALLNWIAAGLVGVAVFKFIFGCVTEYAVSLIGEQLVSDLRQKLYWHLQKLSVSYVDSVSSGSLIATITSDVECIKRFLSTGALDLVYSCCALLFAACFVVVLNWKLALVVFALLPAFAYLVSVLNPLLRKTHQHIRAQNAEVTSTVNESLQGARVIAGYAQEERQRARFAAQQKDIVASALKGHGYAIVLWMGAELLCTVCLVILLWYGVRQVISDSLTIGVLMAFYTYVGMLFAPVMKIASITSFYQEASASWRRLSDILSTRPEIKERAHPVVLSPLRGEIEFKAVNFRYRSRKGENALSDISLRIFPGQSVALVGRSGAGKSTMINLLLRFYDPGEGEVCIDGHNLRDLHLKAYRSQVGVVLQDDYLFNASIRDNILYSRPAASEEQLLAASLQANVHQFASQLPQGYDTIVGEAGVMLSGGQRQRISIARALLRDPAILILDEATSHVDSLAERVIIEETYRKAAANRTTVIIAHRLSTVKHVDRIIVLEAGRIIESGTHDELMFKRKAYWTLHNEQVGLPKTEG